MGYVGLPTAISLHDSGFHVIGIDISESLIQSLTDGRHAISEEAGLTIPNGESWEVTTDFKSSIPRCDIAILCVPTPVDETLKPNVSYVTSALKSVIDSKNPDKDLVIILESTVHPGTTRHCLSEAIGERDQSKLGVMLAYCPERISPGEPNRGVGGVSRVIGADSENLAAALTVLYSSITKESVTPVKSIEVAEASKLVENAQRDIDIAFVNELAIVLPKMGLDVEDVLEASSTKWNFHRHSPGMGVGGHCIPIDPHYYIEFAKKMGTPSAMSPSARQLNSSMPKHSAEEVNRFCDGSIGRILLMGYSYKPNVSDTRETPVGPFIEEVYRLGAKEIFVWDSWVGPNQIHELATPISDPFALENIDCIVICTAHDDILSLDWGRIKIIMSEPRIYDSRRCLNKAEMLEIGWSLHAIGMPL